jgi:23S rRNA (guanosine2251-2'-O)-methyltransferase
MIIYGINPVLEALRAGTVAELRLVDRSGARIAAVVEAAARAGVRIRRATRADLDRAARGGVHQGVVAEVRRAGRDDQAGAVTIADLVSGALSRAATPLLVVLDGVEDPHNVGAILRTVDAAGADGVIRQARRAASLGGAVAKTSAGAVAHVKIVEVVNIARAIEELKDAGVWTVGLAADAARQYGDIDLTLPTALVVGAEGTGLRRLVRERCDWLVSIPMSGKIASLNVSVATGVVLFEAIRQRRGVSSGRV